MTRKLTPKRNHDKLRVQIYGEHLNRLHVYADRVICVLLFLQAVMALVIAIAVSPDAWHGDAPGQSAFYHSLLIGGCLAAIPTLVAAIRPGRPETRWITAAAQMLFSALFIHLMAGRVEAHFHVFGSLALLTIYKDRYVFLPAVLVVVVDHFVRGQCYPESVYGVPYAASWRTLEHVCWVVWTTGFLYWGVKQSLNSLGHCAQLQAELIVERDQLENRIAERTSEIETQRSVQNAIMQTIPASVFWRNKEHQFMGLNDTFTAFLGLRSQVEVIGKTGAEIECIAKRVRNSNSCLANRSLDAEPLLNIEETIYDARGEHRTVLASSTPLKDEHGNTFGTLGIFHDITNLKTAQSHATSLARLIRESPTEMFIFDATTLSIIEANHGFSANMGFSLPELLSMSAPDFMANFDEKELRRVLNEAIDSNAQQCTFHTDHIRSDGTRYPVQIDAHWAAFDGKWVFVAFVQDLTEQQAMLQQLSQAQKLESMGQMAAGIAHEINTPMQCVSGNVEFLQSGYERLFSLTERLIEVAHDDTLKGDDRSENVKALVEKARFERIQAHTPAAIHDAALAVQRVIEIVRAMKSMSHPGHTDHADVDVNDLIEKAKVITRNRWKYQARVKLKLLDRLPIVQGFPAELSQVFMNILVNAADAIAESGKPAEQGEIEVSTSVTEEGVAIQFADNGIGMSEEVQQRVFDQFFTTKDVGRGTGLGMALSYDIVTRKHSGTIQVESNQGLGTTFTITLPLVLPAAVADPTENTTKL